MCGEQGGARRNMQAAVQRRREGLGLNGSGWVVALGGKVKGGREGAGWGMGGGRSGGRWCDAAGEPKRSAGERAPVQERRRRGERGSVAGASNGGAATHPHPCAAAACRTSTPLARRCVAAAPISRRHGTSSTLPAASAPTRRRTHRHAGTGPAQKPPATPRESGTARSGCSKGGVPVASGHARQREWGW